MNSRREHPRVALLTNVLAHYRVPYFQALAQRYPDRFGVFLTSTGMAHRAFLDTKTEVAFPVQALRGLRWHRPPANG